MREIFDRTVKMNFMGMNSEGRSAARAVSNGEEYIITVLAIIKVVGVP